MTAGLSLALWPSEWIPLPVILRDVSLDYSTSLQNGKKDEYLHVQVALVGSDGFPKSSIQDLKRFYSKSVSYHSPSREVQQKHTIPFTNSP